MIDTDAQFTPEEYDLVNRVLLAFQQTRVKNDTRTLKDNVRIWEHIVAQVERGYSLTLAEYQNDLCYRDTLEEVRLRLPEHLNVKLAAWLRPLDARFRDATMEVGKPLFIHKMKAREPWWFRVPLKICLTEGYEEVEREQWVIYAPELAARPAWACQEKASR